MSGDGKTEAMDLDPKGAAADQTLAKDGFEQLTQEYYEGKHISEPVKEIKVYSKWPIEQPIHYSNTYFYIALGQVEAFTSISESQGSSEATYWLVQLLCQRRSAQDYQSQREGHLGRRSQLLSQVRYLDTGSFLYLITDSTLDTRVFVLVCQNALTPT